MSNSCLRRHPVNPILTRLDIPEISPLVTDVTSVFNPGAIWFRDKYRLLLRVQTRGRETVLVPAASDDGVEFEIEDRVIEIRGLEAVGETIYHIYDPRLTEIDGIVYVVFAADVDGACRLGIAKTLDFVGFELVSFNSALDSRNGVLFPERIGGRFTRLERPNLEQVEGGVTSGAEVIVAFSDDLISWDDARPVMAGRCHFWDELIGSGPPPIKTRAGWLHVYHGIARHFGAGIYQAGVVLLDLADPSVVLARSRQNILEPREMWEVVGQVPNVVFPSGMIVRNFDDEGYAKPEGEVLIYYGAADLVVGLATTTVGDLLRMAEAD